MAISSGLMTGISLASAGMKAVGAMQAGKAARKQAEQAATLTEFQAQVSDQQAAREREVAAASAGDFARTQSATAASARAAMGASGVRGDTGTPPLAFGDFAAETELQRLRILSGGEVTARRLEQQAGLQRFEAAGLRKAGKNAQRKGMFRAGASLLTGLGTAAESGFFSSGGGTVGPVAGTNSAGFTSSGYGTGV